MNKIRVIAPSDSWKLEREASYRRATERLEDAGYVIEFGKHVKSQVHLGTSSAEERAQDFNDAFADANVFAIFALHGGFSSNELLPLIDWQVVEDNPKPLFGYSDITVLANAIYAKTGATAYLGPNFGTIGYEELWEYSLQGALQILRNEKPFSLQASKQYIDNKEVHESQPWQSIQDGDGKGVLLGGNIQSFFLLQGTEYLPNFNQEYILAIEDDSLAGEYTLHGLSRNLESILQLPNARQNIRGVLIGRFEADSKVREVDLSSVIKSKDLNVPVLCNVDFGHTTPIATLPIGGTVKLSVSQNNNVITVVSY